MMRILPVVSIKSNDNKHVEFSLHFPAKIVNICRDDECPSLIQEW